MDFCEPDSPQDNIPNVVAVLDFLAQATCWPPLKGAIRLEAKALTGLYLILSACQRTLEKSVKE